ncbi:hypothetical protein AGLY_010202 [Aphis glycines]|uniref:Uncharacterized protein n=1 Tax=Aphis glycines TaxID=307491 RepID=A0A6G0THK3_APHGL|nr:hypothetical protein AGLY_010202 [Aphis glycines]
MFSVYRSELRRKDLLSQSTEKWIDAGANKIKLLDEIRLDLNTADPNQYYWILSLRSSIVFAVLLTCICAQKPFYASSSNQYPSVLPQNLPNNGDLGNRIGENSTPDPYLGSEKQPVYNVEKELVDRITNEYPRDKQPFWYVNAAQLNSIRYQQQPAAVQPQTQQFGSFTPTRRQTFIPQQQQRN